MSDSERYEIYGVIPESHEDNNPDLTLKGQKTVGGTTLIYSTDDREEAKKIVREGGFMKGEGDNQQWFVAQWAKDTQTGGTLGDVPEGVV